MSWASYISLKNNPLPQSHKQRNKEVYVQLTKARILLQLSKHSSSLIKTHKLIQSHYMVIEAVIYKQGSKGKHQATSLGRVENSIAYYKIGQPRKYQISQLTISSAISKIQAQSLMEMEMKRARIGNPLRWYYIIQTKIYALKLNEKRL